MGIKGIEVKLYSKVQTGTDGFGTPVYDESAFTIIDNVLVSPTSSEEILDNLNLYGKKAVYTLAIPKGDTNDWRDRKIEFFDEIWRSFGIPQEGIGNLIPLKWNKKVTVARHE